jgi:hypothetical protein
VRRELGAGSCEQCFGSTKVVVVTLKALRPALLDHRSGSGAMNALRVGPNIGCANHNLNMVKTRGRELQHEMICNDYQDGRFL